MIPKFAVALGLATLLSGRVAMAQICTATTSGPTFGAYDPFATSSSSITGTVSVTCRAVVALGLSYSIQLDGGIGGTIASRAMTSGASLLGYQLYTNSARSVIWGNGTSGSGTVSDGYVLVALGSATKNYTVYGVIPARQMAAPGAYVDTVTVLITY